jgi:integrase
MKHIDRVETRARVAARRDPYWQRLTQGRYVGFRKLRAGAIGTWLARFNDGERYHYQPLGDFGTLPEKERFDAAKRAAEEWFRHLDVGGSTSRSTVKAACEVYVAKLRLENSEAAAKDADGRFTRLVYSDPIGKIDLAKLTPRDVAKWKERALKLKASDGAARKAGQRTDIPRAARSSFNRNATALRAALNLAHDRREVASDFAWSKELRPLEGAEGRRRIYLSPKQRAMLIDKASEEVQPLLRALALLPMRVGEVADLRVERLDVQNRALNIPHGKTEFRNIPLSADALALFKQCAKGKLPSAWLIARADGRQWDRFAWRDQVQPAAKAAKLPAGVSAYTLRHSTITDLVTGGCDLFTVAKISGTSVAMIEKHYGHLQREHARAALESLSLPRAA